MSTATDDSASTVHLGRNVRHVLTTQDLSQVSKVMRRVAICALLAKIVQRKLLVVRYGQDFAAGRQEGRVVHRGVMVERLDSNLVLIGDARVIDVDEAVCRAGEEQERLGGVEGELGDVVGVDFLVVCFLGGRTADIPLCVLVTLNRTHCSCMIVLDSPQED